MQRSTSEKYAIHRTCNTGHKNMPCIAYFYDTRYLINYSFRTKREVRGYVHRTTEFGNLWFELKMSEPPPHGTTWTFKSNDGTRPRYRSWCFAPSCKIAKKVLVLSDFFKTLLHYGFSMKFSAWWHFRKRIKNRTFVEGGRWKFCFCPLFLFSL